LSQTIPELDIERLTVRQRIELIGELWDSIPDEAMAANIPDWHREDLEMRLDAADSHPEQGISRDQAKARFRQRP